MGVESLNNDDMIALQKERDRYIKLQEAQRKHVETLQKDQRLGFWWGLAVAIIGAIILYLLGIK